MNANLTIDTLSFNEVSNGDAQRVRREISRGVSLPTELKTSHTDFTDANKLASTRSVVRFDRYVALSTGAIAPVSAYLVLTRPKDAEVETADCTAVVQHLVSFLQEDDSGLDLMDEFIGGER